MLVRSNDGKVYDVSSKYINGKKEVPASNIIKPENLPTEQETVRLKKLLQYIAPKKQINKDEFFNELRIEDGKKVAQMKSQNPSVVLTEDQGKEFKRIYQIGISKIKNCQKAIKF